MLAAELVVTIPGDPKTKGSLKCIGGRGGRHQLVESHKSSGPWRATVVGWLTKVVRTGKASPAVKGQPVGVEVTFTLPRPKSHYRTRRDPATGVVHLTTVKPAYVDAQPVNHGTGDVDKLTRLILDALQDAGLFPEDCAVVELTARKAFPVVDDRDPLDRLPYPGVRIRLYPL